jgi:hypothetical protein
MITNDMMYSTITTLLKFKQASFTMKVPQPQELL